MRIYKLVVAMLAGVTLGLGARQAAADTAVSDVVARFHFVGTKQLAANPLASNVNQILAMPETVALRDQTLDKLATTPFRLFNEEHPGEKTNDFADLIRPLLDDVLENESYFEVCSPTNKIPELMLAVHVDNQHAAIWQANLATVLSNWTGIAVSEISGDGYKGWELKKHHDPNLIRCLHVGEWVLLGWGWDELKLQPGFIQRIKETQGPVAPSRNDILDLWVDCPAITPYHPFPWASYLTPYKLPKLHLTVQPIKNARGFEIRPQLVMQFPEPLNIKLEPWRFPTNTIRSSMVSFTAIRGIEPWLSQRETIKEIHPSQIPDQVSLWAMNRIPFESYIAVPVQDSTNYLAGLVPTLLPTLNNFLTHRPVSTEAVWMNNRVSIPQMPFVIPSVRPIEEASGDFLLGAMFTTMPRTNTTPLPKELAHEINSKPNLVYYDWELNKERIFQWRQLLQIYVLTSGKVYPFPSYPAQKCLITVSTNLGYCGTEITQTGPSELTLVRNSPVGLTGFELNLLSYWLDSEDFPLDIRYERKHPAPRTRH